MVIPRAEQSCLLTINGGSSSLKFAVFSRDSPDPVVVPSLVGRIERIGLPDARVIFTQSGESRAVLAPNLPTAADWLIDWLGQSVGWSTIAAVAHRVVHGGARYFRPERVSDEMLSELRQIISMDPEHLPGEIAVIERFRSHLPQVPQVACFDTAFHHDLPRIARIIPIPRRYESLGVRRYGFHGLSYAYLMEALERLVGSRSAAGRVILAHLGSGASLAAVRDGRPIDTTMALTPAAGVVMGTRSGDIDPGLPGFLIRQAGLSVDDFDTMINHQSGLIGISETSSDVRDLLEKEGQDIRATEAVAVFVDRVKKSIGAFAAVLGGLDILVFSGGIGENSPVIRARICEGLAFLGLVLDESRNISSAPVISKDPAQIEVRVIKTNEEAMMARYAARFLV